MTTPYIPVDNIISDGDLLYSFLGSFWLKIYKHPEFLRYLQNSRAILEFQLYLDSIECNNLNNREQVPIFKRYRWFPIIIKKSQKNFDKNLLKLGSEVPVVLGPQTNEFYLNNCIFELGGGVRYSNFVYYPVSNLKNGIISCITDNIISPNIVLINGRDFVLKDNILIIHKDADPFTSLNGKYLISDVNDDQEAILWGWDCLVDEDYIYKSLGYIFNVYVPSCDYAKNVLNRIWDIIASGSSLENINQFFAALCNSPTIKENREIIEDIVFQADKLLVITDKNVYKLPRSAILRSKIKKGNELRKGELLDTSVRIYWSLYNENKQFVFGDSDEYLIKRDINSIVIPGTLFNVPLKHGFSLSWDVKPIYYCGNDKNGNAKFKFNLDGTEEDNNIFWDYVWKACENNNIRLLDILNEYLHIKNNFIFGQVCGHIVPMEFFLKHIIGYNTIVVSICFDTLPAEYKRLIPSFAKIIKKLFPVNVRFIIIERKSLSKEKYDLFDNATDSVTNKSVKLNSQDYAILDKRSLYSLSMVECSIQKRWIPACKNVK